MSISTGFNISKAHAIPSAALHLIPLGQDECSQLLYHAFWIAAMSLARWSWTLTLWKGHPHVSYFYAFLSQQCKSNQRQLEGQGWVLCIICSPAWWEVRVGAQGRYLELGTKAETVVNEAYLPVCHGFFCLLSYLTLGHLPDLALPTVAWAFPHQSFVIKMTADLPIGEFYENIF